MYLSKLVYCGYKQLPIWLHTVVKNSNINWRVLGINCTSVVNALNWDKVHFKDHNETVSQVYGCLQFTFQLTHIGILVYSRLVSGKLICI